MATLYLVNGIKKNYWVKEINGVKDPVAFKRDWRWFYDPIGVMPILLKLTHVFSYCVLFPFALVASASNLLLDVLQQRFFYPLNINHVVLSDVNLFTNNEQYELRETIDSQEIN